MKLARRLLIRYLDTSLGLGQRPFYRECNRSSISVANESPPRPLLKYQSVQLWPAGFLLSPTIGREYNIINPQMLPECGGGVP